MALSKKHKPTDVGPKLGLRLVNRGGGLPPRIVLYVILIDDSGSMKPWRTRSGEFVPQVRAAVSARGDTKVNDLVYVMSVVVSGGVSATDFTPLGRAADPEYTPDGQTPIGAALKLVADNVTQFIEQTAFPQEVTIRNLEVLVVSDLHPTEESPEETEAGVTEFLAVMKKFSGRVTVVVPNAESCNKELADRLNVKGGGVRQLDADPKSVIHVTFESLIGASRKLTESAVRIRPE